ncbi:four helix bundle protein [Candidatus Methylomirabilis sp.]|uniref:four helix bundle protein n=1 Tax=Candidatus Methylomirabilis sp. TaxID=2032687 RepID=UPI0030764FA4
MKSLSSYRELIVWQKSIDLAVTIYEITRNYPSEEKFGITSQMRRAATSIPANIAEGQAWRTTGEFLQSLGTARGSLAELETFLILSERLGLLNNPTSDISLKDCGEINKMLNALMKSLSTPH